MARPTGLDRDLAEQLVARARSGGQGLTTGEIQAHLSEIYDMEVSRDLISRATHQVSAELEAWRNRPLDRVYAVVMIDAIVVKIRDGAVANRPVYVAVGINLEGERDVLGMGVGKGGEGAKTWMTWLAGLRDRGVEDVLIACCDGLKGLPDSIQNTWPQTDVQLCVVHMVRAGLTYASTRYWAQIAKELRHVYTAANADAAEARFVALATKAASRFFIAWAVGCSFGYGPSRWGWRGLIRCEVARRF